MSALVSVIVPVYNAVDYIQRCVKSILSQSYQNLELLLVDDGSTDGSGVLCDSFAKENESIKVFHQENKGVSAARNLGIQESKGIWICFVDADDELIPNGIQELVESVTKDAGMVMGGYESCEDNGDIVFSPALTETQAMSSEEGVMLMYKSKPFPYLGFVWGNLYRSDVLKDQGIRFAEDIYFNEDRLFITQYICSSHCRIVFNPKPVYRYHLHSQSAMALARKSFNPKFSSDLEACIRMRDCIEEAFPHNHELHTLANRVVCYAYLSVTRMMKEFHYSDILYKNRLRDRFQSSLPFFKRAFHLVELRIKECIVELKRCFHHL